MNMSPSAQAAKEAAAAWAVSLKSNEHTAAYFAASMLGLMAIITISHWLEEILRAPLSKKNSPLLRAIIRTARTVRGTLLLKTPGFTSIGHACVFTLYVAINITLMFQNLHGDLPGNFARRMGWITACNLSLITFLALKNTPLAFLTSYSYERLNILHQTAGYCIVLSFILHAVTYLVTLSQEGFLHIMRAQNQVMGIVAGSTILAILTTALTLRRISYEAFYVTHVTLFMLLIIALGLHRPFFYGKAIYIFIFTAGIWALDRLYRFSKISWFVYGNTASVVPLGQKGVRIELSRTPEGAVPGTHVFLWIPKIRVTETHPFTIVSTNPLELVVSAHDGFTKDLLSFASRNPGTKLRASCDGPYGTLPKFSNFDHVILIAGGSGASFTFGVALDLVRRANVSTGGPIIHFIWVVREPKQQSWFVKELAELNTCPLVILTVHVTRPEASSAIHHTSDKFSNDEGHQTPADYEKPPLAKPNTGVVIDEEQGDSKKEAAVRSGSLSSLNSSFPVIHGRPDMMPKIHEIVNNTKSSDSTIVAGCGPEGLMLEVRQAVAEVVSTGERNVTLHCEQFGW